MERWSKVDDLSRTRRGGAEGPEVNLPRRPLYSLGSRAVVHWSNRQDRTAIHSRDAKQKMFGETISKLLMFM
jgi:hypothetical protein